MATKPRAGGRRVRRLSATEVQRGFSDVVNRVYYRREVIVVERGGEPVCEIVPATDEWFFTGADFVELLKAIPGPGKAWADAVDEAAGGQPAAEGEPWPR